MLDRTVAPPFVKSPSFHLISPRITKLSNGVEVFMVPGGSQDVLKIELVFEAGRWHESKTTASHFCANMLSKGTAHKGSFEISRIFDQYGAHLEVHPGLDFVSISLYALARNLAPVLELLLEILTVPAFPENEFRQAQAIFIQNLQINNGKTSYVASQVFRRNLFGETHPYGVEVTEGHVKSLEIPDLKKHFNEHVHSARVFVSGKVDDVARQLIEDAFKDLPPASRRKPLQHLPYEVAPGFRHLEKKDSVQSSVRTGGVSVLRTHPDYIPVLFVAHILGGYFGSRLMKNIREEKGLTYGISASVHGLKHGSYLVIGADVNKENVDLTFGEIERELQRLRNTEISSDELETTRNHFIGSLQSEITTPFAHAEKIKTITLFGLQPDHYQQMIARIERITPADIIETATRYFQEETFLRVAVG